MHTYCFLVFFSLLLFRLLNHFRTYALNDPKPTDMSWCQLSLFVFLWMMNCPFKPLSSLGMSIRAKCVLKITPILFHRCHIVSQSESMLAKFVASLVFSARLWYAFVLKLLYLVYFSNLYKFDRGFLHMWCFYLI